MNRILASLLASIAMACVACTAAADQPHVRLHTNVGDIELKLDRDKAPVTVENFLRYVDDGFYNGTIFHRVISNFMIQGGGYTSNYAKKPTRPPIENEADNGLKNTRGTIAMARTMNPDSATSQFFINTVDNTNLDHVAPTHSGWGYAVFGRVVEGMDVVDRIGNAPTGSGGPFQHDVPLSTVVIEKATVVSADGKQ